MKYLCCKIRLKLNKTHIKQQNYKVDVHERKYENEYEYKYAIHTLLFIKDLQNPTCHPLK